MISGIENAAWEVLQELTITHAHLRDLTEQLESDFNADNGGYRQLRALSDPQQQAVVSDLICMTTCAIRDNLVEARLHQQQLDRIVGDGGIRYPEQATYKDTLRRGAEMDMAITGCTRALVSALDCLGAVAIGVLRMPYSLIKGSFHDIEQTMTSKLLASGTAKQRSVWADLCALSSHHRKQPPAGWLSWLFGMRNLNVHRARQVHILLQRIREPDQPQIVVPTADPERISKEMARFDLHLRRRPELADMHDFVTAPKTTDLWINERATTTLPGIIRATNDLIEEACHYLVEWWRYAGKWPSEFPPPTAKWRLPSPPFSSFYGVAPSAVSFPLDVSRASPLLTERLKLAERLRTR